MDAIKVEIVERDGYDDEDDVKINVDDDNNPFSDNILLQNNDIGKCIEQELAELKDSTREKNVKIICKDGFLFAHSEAFLLSTGLLDELPSWKDEELTVICRNVSCHIVNLVLEVLYTGSTLFSNIKERLEVEECLRNFAWVGAAGDSFSKSVPKKYFATAASTELPKVPDLWKRSSRNFGRNENGGEELASMLAQHPVFQQDADKVYCTVCHNYPSLRSGIKKGLAYHLQTVKHMRAVHQKGGKKVRRNAAKGDEENLCLEQKKIKPDSQTNKDNMREFREWLEFYTDAHDEEDGHPGLLDLPHEENDDLEQRSEGAILQARLQEFEDLIEFEGHVMCRYCKLPLKWKKKSNLCDHLRSVRHLRKKKLSVSANQLDEKLETEDRKSAIQCDSEKEEKVTQEKKCRLEEFPWLVMFKNEILCFFCKCPVDWIKRKALLEHSKTRKHQALVEEKNEQYPDLIKKVREAEASLNHEPRPNNNNKLRYRIYLKYGTPALQKLWVTGILLGSIVDEVSLCYVCFKLFMKEDELSRHLENDHPGLENKLMDSPYFNNETKEYFCHGCNRFRVPRGSLMFFLLHNLSCTGNFNTVSQPRKCLLCEETFTEYSQFKAHMQAKHMKFSTDDTAFDEHADKLARNSSFNSFPLETPRRNYKKRFRHTCPHCTENPPSYSNKKELRVHMRKAHNILPIQCKQCPAKFKTFKAVSKHVVKFHVGVKNFSCETCGKMFYAKYDLARHTRTHMDPDQRPFSCLACGMRFKEQKHLNNHEATHSEERPHRCLMCDARFKIRDRLSKHCIKDHGISMKAMDVFRGDIVSEMESGDPVLKFHQN